MSFTPLGCPFPPLSHHILARHLGSRMCVVGQRALDEAGLVMRIYSPTFRWKWSNGCRLEAKFVNGFPTNGTLIDVDKTRFEVEYNGRTRVYDEMLQPVRQSLAVEEFDKIKAISAVCDQAMAQEEEIDLVISSLQEQIEDKEQALTERFTKMLATRLIVSAPVACIIFPGARHAQRSISVVR